MAETLPDLWVIFDSRGYYRTDESERSARLFCERYNEREGDDPLKPYTYRRYTPAATPGVPPCACGLKPGQPCDGACLSSVAPGVDLPDGSQHG